MNILITPTVTDLRETDKQKLVLLVRSLLVPKNIVGFLDNGDIGLNPTHANFRSLENLTDINENEWDVVLVLNTDGIALISRKIKRKPILFIANGTRVSEQFCNLPNLYQIIYTTKTSSKVSLGIPDEFIEIVKIPTVNLSRLKKVHNRQKNNHLVYIVSDLDEDLTTSRAIVKTANQIPEIRLHVFGTVRTIDLLTEIANSNITFSTKAFKKQTLNEYSIVIAEGDFAAVSLMNNTPVIVLGKKGLGGLVNLENIDDFIRTGFTGRIGGQIGEDIPISLLSYEITRSLELIREDRLQVSGIATKVANNYYTIDWKKQILKILKRNIALYELVNNSKLSLKLVPKVADSISIESYGKSNECLIINRLTAKLVGSIGVFEKNILESCNGSNTIAAIISMHEKDLSKEICDFIIELWKNKLVVFKS